MNGARTGSEIDASVIVMTRDREALLRKTIDALLAEKNQTWELIVVDDTPNPSPDTRAFLEARARDLRYVRLSTANLPRAGNVGITLARGRIVIFVDDDVIPCEGFVRKHVDAYGNDARIGGVMGRIRQWNFPEWEPAPSREMGFNALWHKHFNWKKRQAVAVVRGCNMSFRRDVLVEIGGCDERFIAEGMRWDTDLGYMVRKAGYLIMYDPEPWLEHLYVPTGGARTRGLDLKKTAKYYQNNFILLFKHRPPLSSAIYYAVAVFLAGYLRKELLREPPLLWRVPAMFWRGMRAARRIVRTSPGRFLPCDVSAIGAAAPASPDAVA